MTALLPLLQSKRSIYSSLASGKLLIYRRLVRLAKLSLRTFLVYVTYPLSRKGALRARRFPRYLSSKSPFSKGDLLSTWRSLNKVLSQMRKLRSIYNFRNCLNFYHQKCYDVFWYCLFLFYEDECGAVWGGKEEKQASMTETRKLWFSQQTDIQQVKQLRGTGFRWGINAQDPVCHRLTRHTRFTLLHTKRPWCFWHQGLV